MTVGWSSSLAERWKSYTPPSRPSYFDLYTIQRYIDEKRRDANRRLRMLILGSTTEFRDLAVRERLSATVVDNSLAYHSAISAELLRLPDDEVLVNQSWQQMELEEGVYDVAVGDLVVGNLLPEELEGFLQRISVALRPGGLFITKSFFRLPGEPIKHPSQWRSILANPGIGDLFTEIAYDLTLYLADPLSGNVLFSAMYNFVADQVALGELPVDLLERVESLGWNSDMKIRFTVYDEADWLATTQRYFVLTERVAQPFGPLRRFPLYVLMKS